MADWKDYWQAATPFHAAFFLKESTMSEASSKMRRPADAWLDDMDKSPGFNLDELVDTNPGAKMIADAFAKYPNIGPTMGLHLDLLARYGYDPSDPDVIERAIKVSVEVQEGQRPSRPDDLVRRSVVYYMRIGDRIKIGTSVSPRERLDHINPEELVTLEWGGITLERQRHRQFSGLRTNGEWFKLQEPLLRHMMELDARFVADFGKSLSVFMDRHRLVTGETCKVARSRI